MLKGNKSLRKKGENMASEYKNMIQAKIDSLKQELKNKLKDCMY